MSIEKLMEACPGELITWVPEGNTKTPEELLTEPLDAIYVTRKQVEREEVRGIIGTGQSG